MNDIDNLQQGKQIWYIPVTDFLIQVSQTNFDEKQQQQQQQQQQQSPLLLLRYVTMSVRCMILS